MNIIKLKQLHLIFCIDCLAAFTYAVDIEDIVENEVNRVEADIGCGCPSTLAPVCSDYMITYVNFCELECNREKFMGDGYCDEINKNVLRKTFDLFPSFFKSVKLPSSSEFQNVNLQIG